MNGKCRLLLAASAIALTPALPRMAAEAPPSDSAAIARSEEDYARAYLACDVARFRTLIGDDFLGVLADGTVINRDAFLRQAALPPAVTDFRYHPRSIRLYGDAAVVNADVAYKRPDGSLVLSRCVHVYVRRDGAWRIVSAQLTRMAGP